MHRLVAIVILGAAGCRLGPLVDDQPGASANVLPGSAMIPSVATRPDLIKQISLNDGLDTNALMASNNVILRGTTGFTPDGTQVKYWAFGNAGLAPTPIYIFGRGDPTSASFSRIDSHLPLVEVLPGEIDYAPIHTIYRVAVTDKYNGEKITSLGALSDAIDLQLVEPPVAIKVFVNWPIVRPGLQLEVGTGAPLAPTQVYAHGYIADSFPLGGALGMQPNPFGILPTSQVSFLREAGKLGFDPTRPIFQASIPQAPAQMVPNYTPVSAVVNVDLVPTKLATDIRKDSDLFTRATDGSIVTATANVAGFTVTNQLIDLQIQFKEGLP